MCACLLNCLVCPNDRYARNNYVEGWMHVLVYTHWRCVCVLECWALCSCMGSLQQYYNIQFMCVHFEKPKNAYKNKHYEMCAHSHTFSHVHMRSNVDVIVVRPLAYSISNEKKMGILHLYILILLLYLLHRETRGRILFLHILCVYDQRNAYWHMYTSHLNFHASFFIFISLFFFILWLSV